jgi:hypothetical protein
MYEGKAFPTLNIGGIIDPDIYAGQSDIPPLP